MAKKKENLDHRRKIKTVLPKVGENILFNTPPAAAALFKELSGEDLTQDVKVAYTVENVSTKNGYVGMRFNGFMKPNESAPAEEKKALLE